MIKTLLLSIFLACILNAQGQYTLVVAANTIELKNGTESLWKLTNINSVEYATGPMLYTVSNGFTPRYIYYTNISYVSFDGGAPIAPPSFTVLRDSLRNRIVSLANNRTTSAADSAVFATKYFVQSQISGVSIAAFGAIGDGVTDNTSAIQNTINYASLHRIPVLFPDGVFLSNVLTVASNLNIVGIGLNAVLLKNPATANQDHKIFRCSETEDYNNISIKNIKLDGNNSYTNHVFSTNSNIKDSNSVLIALNRVYGFTLDNVTLNGSEVAFSLYNVNNITVKNSTFQNIGAVAIQTNYQQNITNVTLDNDRFLSYGCRDHWDYYFNNVRNGETAIQGGGSNWSIVNSHFFNGANTKWASIESRFTSDILIQNCDFDANGLSSMSLSLQGNNGNKLKRISIDNNRFQNIGAISYTASDTLNGRLKYEFLSYHEMFGLEDYTISHNYFKNCAFGFGACTNGIFLNNIVNDSTILNGAIFSFGDTLQKSDFASNSIYGNKNQGQIFRLSGFMNQSKISENILHFDDDGNRNIFAFLGSNTNQFNGVTISGNTVKGYVNNLFSSTIGNNSVANCYVSNNDFSATNINRANMFTSNVQSAGFYIYNNSFFGGKIESDSIIVPTSSASFDSTTIKQMLALKVDKVNGLGLSENNYINGDMNYLHGLTSGVGSAYKSNLSFSGNMMLGADNAFYTFDGNQSLGFVKSANADTWHGAMAYGSTRNFTIAQSSTTDLNPFSIYTNRFIIDISGNVTIPALATSNGGKLMIDPSGKIYVSTTP